MFDTDTGTLHLARSVSNKIGYNHLHLLRNILLGDEDTPASRALTEIQERRFQFDDPRSNISSRDLVL